MALSKLTKVQTLGIGSNIEVVGVITTGQFKSGTSNLHSSGVELTNLNVSGIATIGGNVSIGGTLTYQDVTNIDSVGLITARSGINVSGGTATFAGDLSIADKIIHTGDTNTAIRFPAADTFSVETAGSERLRIASDGNMGLGTNSLVGNAANVYLTVNGSTLGGIALKANGTTQGYLQGTSSLIRLSSDGSKPITFDTNGSERLRIDSSGRLLLGTTSHTGHALSSSNNPKLQLESTSNADYGRMSFVYNGNDGVGPGLWFGKSRGTSIGSNTVVQNGDQIGGLFFHAADGTDKHSRVAAITAVVDGTPGANDTPGKIVFATCPDGTAATTDRMVINKDGHVTKPYHPAFRAGRNSTQTPGVNGTIVFDYVSSPTHFNQGGHYNTSNGAFTAPVAGVYSFDCQVLFQNLSNGQDMVDAIYFRYNSSGGATGGDLVSYDRRRAEYINGETGQGGYFSTHTSVILDMAAGSSVYVRNQRSGLEVHGNVNYTYFQGYLIG